MCVIYACDHHFPSLQPSPEVSAPLKARVLQSIKALSQNRSRVWGSPGTHRDPQRLDAGWELNLKLENGDRRTKDVENG